MAAFNPAEFSSVLKKAIGSRSSKQFAEDAGISKYQVSRRLQGALSAPPRKSTLALIASVSQNGVTYEELLISCGYMDKPGSLTAPEKDAPEIRQEVKKARACILSNMDALHASLKIPEGAPQVPCDFELLVGEDPGILWDFVCIPSAADLSEVEQSIKEHCADVMFRRLIEYFKMSFLTRKREQYDACISSRPKNLNANVSVILYDPDDLEVISEEELSRSVTSPLPDGACSFQVKNA